LSHHWFRETFAMADDIAAEKLGDGSTAYEVLDRHAGALPPGSEKLFFLPHLGGRACPGNTDMKGSWFGFSWTHRREHFYRSILEAVAYEQHLQFQAFRAANPELDVREITAYGGGSKSSLWNQIKADVLGVTHVLLDKEDLAPLGNAILAGYALGIYDDMAETSERFVKRTSRFDSRPEMNELYKEYVAFYEGLLKQTSPSFADLSALPTWESQVS
jgi:xylulokinase